ncbi:unannotated protein [freshwater metagenome]|uniref:Unannotated protein n=1 Tax=freshwater metagenome TaxID=449393 RepID=A0A6J7HET7_9ZZZZ
MSIKANTVTGAMNEIVAKARRSNDASRDCVNFFTRRSDRCRLDRRRFSFKQNRIRLSNIGGNLTSEHASCDVAAIAIHRATEIA